MAGFEHGPHEPAEQQTAETSARNARYGLVLFAVYLVLYGGFVLLNAFEPGLMETMPLNGVNLAILYGFALIVAAWVLALVYGWLCRSNVAAAEEDRGLTIED